MGGEEVDQQQTIKILTTLERLETKMDQLGNVRDIAVEALQSATSAHKRLDTLQNEVEKKVADSVKNVTEDVKEIKDDQKWLWRTVGGAIIAGFVALLYQLIKTGTF